MNKLSIMMPFYNCENTIEQALLSINNQSILDKSFCPQIDLILVDNKSTDNTKSICEKIIQNLSKKINIHFLNCEIQGISPARNTALYYAFSLNFDYMAILDADDEWNLDKLEKQINYINDNKNCDILGTQIYYIDSKNRIFDNSNHPIEDYNIKKYIKKGINPISNSSVLIKKEVFIKCGSYEPTYHLCEDFHLLARASEWFNFHNINEYLTKYRFLGSNPLYVEDCAPTCASHFFSSIEKFHKHEHSNIQ